MNQLLQHINSPKDLKKLEAAQLPEFCNELRQLIIDEVSLYGGHFAASLGVVELSVALHYVMNAPKDKIVWDVGHQAYAHKILTGRKAKFSTNRKKNGISGFPNRSESEYDAFGTGHSSTSISSVLGMAIAAKLHGDLKQQHIAVIGDGALTAGMAFEAMNHAGISDTNILIILNDNDMSIDKSVGSLHHFFSETNIKKDCTQSAEEVASFFSALGLKYFGPIDGHDVKGLVTCLQELKNIEGPKVLHIKTIKGKGYEMAEGDQVFWHAPGTFDKITGKINKKENNEAQPPKYQDVFGKTIVELAKINPLIMGITPAMGLGSSLNYMLKEFPNRAIDVGIAEQHAVTLSAGLATQGMKVFCNIYSTFLQRAYDSLIHDVAIQNLPVIFCLDRAGLVGADGATHHGVFDIAFLRCIPNMIVTAPMNESELRNLMYTAQLESTQHPFSIRYPRGQGVLIDWQTPMKDIEIGKGRCLQEGESIAILSFGHPGNFVLEALKDSSLKNEKIGHYDMRFAKPLDENLLHNIAKRYQSIITVEDGCILGGFGSAVLEFLNKNQYNIPVEILGVPDYFIPHASPEEQQEMCGFDQKAIMNTIQNMLKNNF